MLGSNELIVGRKYRHNTTKKLAQLLSFYNKTNILVQHATRVSVQNTGTFMKNYSLVEQKTPVKNKGLHRYRFKQNPMEKKFADAWEEQNQNDYGTLNYLLSVDSNHPASVTDREREVAATVIQWLGSPCGLSLVKSVLQTEHKCTCKGACHG